MKRNLYLMYAISLLQGMVFYAPVATLYRQAHGISFLQITYMESISFALCLLLELPWGILADKIGYRSTLIFCSTLYFLSKIIFWQATGFWGFLSERILLSIVQSGFSGVDSSILYLSCEKGESQKVFGIYNSLATAGLFAAAIVFSLFSKDNYSLAGFLTVLSYGLAAILSFSLKEVKEKKVSASLSFRHLKADLKQALATPGILLFLIATALFSETHQTITVFLNQLQYKSIGLNDSFIGVLYIISTIIGIAGVYSSTFTRKKGLRFSLFSVCLAASAAAALPAFFPHPLPSVLGILMLRFSNSLFQPIQLEIQNRQIQSENRATLLSINAMLTSCIAILTNLLFGILTDFALPAAFLFGSALCLTSFVLFFYWFRHVPESR